MAALPAHTRAGVAGRPSLLRRAPSRMRSPPAWPKRGTTHSVAARSSPDQLASNSSVVLEEGESGLQIRITAARSDNGSSGQAGGGSPASSGQDSELRIELPLTQTQLQEAVSALDLTRISHPQLLQLMELGHRYKLPDLLSAAAAALEATPGQWEWETALAVFSLPAGCSDSKAFSGAISAAAATLQQQLGDLELVHNDPTGVKQQQLRELTFAALKQLLQDPATRVHSENTVLYSIQHWHEHQAKQLQGSEAGRAQLQQQATELLGLVRMRHCSQLYVATVFGDSDLAASCLTPAELRLAAVISGRSAGARNLKAAEDACSPVLAKHPAWAEDKRPASALQQIFQWRVPVSKLEDLLSRHFREAHQALARAQYEDMDSASHTTEQLCPTTLVWQGRKLALQLKIDSSYYLCNGVVTSDDSDVCAPVSH